MYVLNISYEIALSGGYGRNSLSIPFPVGDYFHQRGAMVTHTHYCDRDLVLGNDHLSNILKILCSVGKKGYDKLELTLSNAVYNEIKDKFEAISSSPELPDLIAKIIISENQEIILDVIFKGRFSSMMEAELAVMSPQDIDKMLENIESDKPVIVIEKPKIVPSEEALTRFHESMKALETIFKKKDKPG